MTSSHTLQREVKTLVLEQIFAFKEPTEFDDQQLLEYHLRYLQIISLYRELDKFGWQRVSGKA